MFVCNQGKVLMLKKSLLILKQNGRIVRRKKDRSNQILKVHYHNSLQHVTIHDRCNYLDNL